MGTVAFQIFHAEPKKPRSRRKAFAVLWMRRAVVLLLQMDKRSCDLDQAFEIKMILIPLLQPEMFEHVMGFIIFLLIETLEITQVAGIQRKRRLDAQPGNKGK